MYGVGKSSLKWFKNYLSDREQTVEINGGLGTHKGRGTSGVYFRPFDDHPVSE